MRRLLSVLPRSVGAVVFALPLLLGVPTSSFAQEDLEHFIDRYAGTNGVGYLTPFAEVFGANLNSGFVRSAKLDDGFHLRLEFVVPSAAVGDDQRTFSATTDGVFSPQQTAEAPTILGSDTHTSVTGEGGTVYVFPAGFQLTRLGTVIPQLTIGNVAGTEFTVRWMAFNLEDFGDFSHIGGGIRHSVSQYFDGLPVDLAVAGMVQTLSFGDVVDATATTFGLHGSTESSMVTLYGGVMYEMSTMDVSYTQGTGGASVDLSLDGHSGIRATAGLGVHLPVVQIRGDITVGSQTVFGIGLALGN